MTKDQLKIIRLLKKSGLSQKAFGSEIGVSQVTVSYWVNGVKNPDKRSMKLVENIFNKPQK